MGKGIDLSERAGRGLGEVSPPETFATTVAMHLIWDSVSVPANDGIGALPFVTRSTTSA